MGKYLDMSMWMENNWRIFHRELEIAIREEFGDMRFWIVSALLIMDFNIQQMNKLNINHDVYIDI